MQAAAPIRYVSSHLLTSGNAMEGLMRIGRVIIIPAILALSAAGTVVAGSAMPAAAAQVTAAHVVAQGALMAPSIYYHA